MIKNTLESQNRSTKMKQGQIITKKHFRNNRYHSSYFIVVSSLVSIMIYCRFQCADGFVTFPYSENLMIIPPTTSESISTNCNKQSILHTRLSRNRGKSHTIREHNCDHEYDHEFKHKGNFFNRRSFLRNESAVSFTLLINYFFTTNYPASAYDNDLDPNDPILDIDQKERRIILQTSSKNIPQKYPFPSSKKSINNDSISNPNPISESKTTSSTSQQSQDVNRITDADLSNDNNERIGLKSSSTTTSTVQTQPTSVERFCNDETNRINVFEKAAPSVVYIDTFIEQRDAFSTNVMEVPVGTGSGFVWDDKGHIVTNYHVVRSAQSAQIAILTKLFPDEDKIIASEQSLYTSTRRKKAASTNKQQDDYDPNITKFTRKVYKARVVGVDPGKDIAVLKVDAPVYDLYPIDVGTSQGLKVGQSAYAIGNPFGLDHTLTVGVVSGTGREVKSPIGRPISNVIQTDAAINPGNSGGPLLDSSGKLIGINTSIFSPSGASAGIGFAIPVDSVKFIVETLIRDGKIIRPVLGISYLESTQARALGINRGVLVLDVPTNTPAYKAGLKGTKRTETGLIELGDIIVKIEDIKINTEADLFEALESFKPGDSVKVTVDRANLESPNSTKLQLRPKVLTIQLRASSDITASRYMYPAQ